MVRARTRDAPHINPDALERYCVEMGGPLSTKWRREAECEIVVDESRAVLPEFSANEKHVVGECGAVLGWSPPLHRDWYIGADVGYLDLTAILLGWFDFEQNCIVVEDERILVRPTSADIQAASLELERVHVPPPQRVLSRHADAPAIVLADLRSQQPKGADDALYWRLPLKDDKEAAVNAVRLAIARHQLRIHPRCRHLIAHMRGAIWNKSRTEFERSEVVVSGNSINGGHFDAVDALVYLVRAVDRRRNPEPPMPVLPDASRALGDVARLAPSAPSRSLFSTPRRRL
jgi:hypothetical protein